MLKIETREEKADGFAFYFCGIYRKHLSADRDEEQDFGCSPLLEANAR